MNRPPLSVEALDLIAALIKFLRVEILIGNTLKQPGVGGNDMECVQPKSVAGDVGDRDVGDAAHGFCVGGEGRLSPPLGFELLAVEWFSASLSHHASGERMMTSSMSCASALLMASAMAETT